MNILMMQRRQKAKPVWKEKCRYDTTLLEAKPVRKEKCRYDTTVLELKSHKAWYKQSAEKCMYDTKVLE